MGIMRALNIAAALSGALALAMLALSAHALSGEGAERVLLDGFIQLSAAAAGLAISNRAGWINFAAGALILAGAAVFAGVLYTISLTHDRSLAMAAPAGGFALILGWALLAFAKPGSRAGQA